MKTEYHILSLGAGVQSTMLALLSHRQDAPKYVPKFDAAIFADTQEEPAEVYRHLEWLAKEVSPSFPVIITTAGKLGDDLMFGKGPSSRFASIPAFTAVEEGEPLGMTKRQCSKEYKVEPVERSIRRDFFGLQPRKRIPKNIKVHHYFGLSAEEGKRIYGRDGRAGVRQRVLDRGGIPHFPLYDMLLKREQIKAWLADKVPHETPRSACVFCPYHSNAEWARIRDNSPEEWARCVQIDEALRMPCYNVSKSMEHRLYLHNSCVPLAEADLSVQEQSAIQGELNFSLLECEGMCGL